MTNILVVALILALISLIFLWLLTKKKLETALQETSDKLSQEKKTSQKEKADYLKKISNLESKIKALSKYETVVNAEEVASTILSTAETNASSLIQKAQQEFQQANRKAEMVLADAEAKASDLIKNGQLDLENAKQQSAAILATATKDAQGIRIKADNLLSAATIDARKIVDNANRKAEEIAGDAYKAMQDAESLAKTAQAMKNVIEGYGDQYLLPTYSLLDELADEFGYLEAGQELKRVRDQIRLMIKNGTAAKCDYVETNRRETAINFVVDAFNGKVDTILANVKRDNFGTLEQKIKDAFQVVNFNGTAFRNAEITEEYLKTRLDELKWAVVVQELRWQEKEEQRQIKERIREEEKARREYEKAIRDAEKEEEMLKKALEKVQKEIAKASEEQKAKYEGQLQELADKLKAAEEKNQRALSMAQQTKSGNVYIISNVGSFGGNVYKIGMTRRLEPLDRIRELGDASVPFSFDVHAMIYSNDAPSFEKELHKKFISLQMNKVNPRKEFFKISLKNIRDEIEKLGINAKWTMSAEATEYRESLALEQLIGSNKEKQQEWLKYQLEHLPSDHLETGEENEDIM